MSVAAIRQAIEHRDELVRLADIAIDELIRQHIQSRPVDQKTDVHTEHCCVLHGCKYGYGLGDDYCPIETGDLIQSMMQLL